MRYPHLFEPLDMGPFTLRNRVMMTVHGEAPGARNLAYFEARAAGGVGLMCVPGAGAGVRSYRPWPGRFIEAQSGDFDAVLPDPTTAAGVAFFDRQAIPALRALGEAGHRHGAVVVSQAYHLGGNGGYGWLHPGLSPSAVRDETYGIVPHAMTIEQIEGLVFAFGQAARRVRDAGLDGIELHAAHGYLLQQFLSPATNLRTDAYGGDFDRRLVLLRQILAAVERHAGADFPVGLRINGTEELPGGLRPGDVAAIVGAVSEWLTYVNVSGGNSTGQWAGTAGTAYASPWMLPAGHNVPSAAAIRRAVGLPVIVAGRITTPEQADRLIAGGTCDVVGMARGLIADPQWVEKARDGRPEEIRPCIGCNECHAFHTAGRGHFVCTVNPVATRELELAPVPAAIARRVLVVGGGPAGTEVALVAARRGHRVVLCERLDRLGGQAALVAMDPDQPLVGEWLAYQARQLDVAGVDVRLASEVDRQVVAALAPEVVVVATGATPRPAEFPVVAGSAVSSIDAVLAGVVAPAGRVVVVGGVEEHARPLGAALLLARRGCSVTLTSELLVAGRGLEERTLLQQTARLAAAGVSVEALTAVTGYGERQVGLRHVLTGATGSVAGVDWVVLATGGVADDRLAPALAGLDVQIHLVGDAVSPRRMVNAVLEGARLAQAL